ncbi:ChbG/HpnK family deacetylase [uncultured Roseibium sp.]|uniref:ChbG/HpnK family deacetylase n=1 Tax=uncultured Roseibium sp. TaxID=1936171 RepID=UPI002592F1B5|nr:ChbG/HpnK family deacetylase [uncultured Roseibium sp.]
MKRITLGALDYGLAFGVDRTLRTLLLEGRLSAVGCIVATDLWPREFKPLQDVAAQVGERALFGLTLALSGDRVHPLSERMQKVYGNEMPTRASLERRAMVRLLPEEILTSEIRAQVSAYTSKMGREPDFVTIRESLFDRSAIVRLVINALSLEGFSENPKIVTAIPPGLHTARIRHIATKAGFDVLPWGPPLPETEDPDELQVQLQHHFDGLSDMTFVACLPGAADDRLRRDEAPGKIAVREAHREVLASERFFHTLDERGVFLY